MMSFFLLSILGCQPEPETGINRTDIYGYASIVPQSESEKAEGEDESDNDALEFAQDIGSLSYRRVLFTGTCDDYRTAGPGGPSSGDQDHLQFVAPFTGNMTLELIHSSSVSLEDGLELETEDPLSYDVTVYDLENISGGTPPDEETAYSILLDTTTDGSYGAFSTSVNVIGGGSYAVKIGGRQNKADDPNSYTLKISGYDPNGVTATAGQELPAGWVELNGEIYVQPPKRFLVGAYLSSEFTAKGSPVGGSDVVDFQRECYCPGSDEEVCTISDSCMTAAGSSCTPPDADADGSIDNCVTLTEPEVFDWDPNVDEEKTQFTAYGLTETWTGSFHMRDVKKVTTCVDGDGDCEAGAESARFMADSAADTGSEDTGSTDTGEPATEPATEPAAEPATEEEEEEPPTTTYVVESISSVVNIFGGSFPSLNSGLVAGMMFSSESAEVDLSMACRVELESSYREEIRGVGVLIDTVQPKVYGWTHEEVEPNNAADYGDYYTMIDTSGAGQPDVSSGPGIVDVITGTLDFAEEAAGDWSPEHDIFALTVTESSGAFVTMDWSDASYDLDLHLYNSAGEIVAYSWYTKPEVFDSIAEFEVILEPGETYYIAALGWDITTIGSTDYTIEVEWLTP
jgi:hypothetical protein